MLLIEYVGHIGHRSLTDGHLGRHLEYFKTLKDARVASVGFIKFNASTTRINKENNFKIKFQVILVFYQTKTAVKFQKNQFKTVGGVVPTRYPLFINIVIDIARKWLSSTC